MEDWIATISKTNTVDDISGGRISAAEGGRSEDEEGMLQSLRQVRISNVDSTDMCG